MQSKNLAIVGGVVGLIAMLLGWSLPSILQNSQQKVDQEASVHIERARRALHQYNAGVGYKSNALGEMNRALSALSEVGVEGEFDIQNPKLSEEAQDVYQERHAAAWEKFQPMDWKLVKDLDDADPQEIVEKKKARPASASYTNIDQQLAAGSKDRSEIIKQNSAILQEALKNVDQALGQSSGDASGRTNVEANWLKAIILYHQGLASAAEAASIRRQALPLLGELRALDAAAAGLQPLTNLTAGSEVEKGIQELEKLIKEGEGKLRELQAKATQVDASKQELQAKLADAEKRAEGSRQDLDKLRGAGIDFSNPKGADVYAERMSTLDKAYRSALREIQALKRGTLPKANIDGSGDYLSGRYVEGAGDSLTTQFGLDHYVGEGAILTEQIAGQQAMIKQFEAARDSMKRDESNYKARTTAVENEIKGADGLAHRAAETHDKLQELDKTAFDMEEKALQTLQKSAESSKAAASAAERAMGEAREAFNKLTPTKQERSAFSLKKDDGWVAGYIGASEADARLARAVVLLQRHLAYQGYTTSYAGLSAGLGLKEADANSETYQEFTKKAQEANEAGTQEIALAMTTLADAHRKVGQHWTITALAGSARSLMAQFGFPKFRDEALEDYRNALKGRDDKQFARWIVERISALEAAK